ncbi:MAG: hypothetical protein QOC82_2448 [Frankiaceae bacterium]|nr:hypothetical protein [Frankiaceae bacterium]
MANISQFRDFDPIMMSVLSVFAASARETGFVMSEPIVAVSLALVCTICVLAIVLTSRPPDGTREASRKPKREKERRYLNGGWH